MAGKRWASRALIAAGVLGALGFGAFMGAPYLGTVWRDGSVRLEHVAPNAMAPNFAVLGADRVMHQLSDYRGRMVVAAELR